MNKILSYNYEDFSRAVTKIATRKEVIKILGEERAHCNRKMYVHRLRQRLRYLAGRDADREANRA